MLNKIVLSIFINTNITQVMNRKKFFFKKIFFAVLILYASNQLIAQTIKRQCISSYGASTVTAGSALVSQTAGQSYSTAGVQNASNDFLQGFQQPVTFAVSNVSNVAVKLLDVDIYPNPASYSIKIAAKEEMKNYSFVVFSASGKLIFADKVSGMEKYEINCSGWTNGIYFINISDNENNSKKMQLVISR